jgi:tetratricopeptide (TPR) repeat protein
MVQLKRDKESILVQAFSAVKDFERCLTIAESVVDNRKKADILNNIASTFAEAGMNERAVEVAQTIIKLSREDHEISERAERLGKMAKMLSDIGVGKEAIELANEVLKIAKAINKPISETSVKSNIVVALASSAHALARTGRFDQAMEVAESISREVDPSPWVIITKAEALKVLVEELIKAGMIDRAVEIANKMAELVKNNAFEDNRTYAYPAYPNVSSVKLLVIVAQALFAVRLSNKATELANRAFAIVEETMKKGGLQ